MILQSFVTWNIDSFCFWMANNFSDASLGVFPADFTMNFDVSRNCLKVRLRSKNVSPPYWTSRWCSAAEMSFNFSLCLICQREKSEQLVHNPSSHEKVLKFVEEWARYGDLRYYDLWSKLKLVSISELIETKTSWHRSCYQETVHTGLLKRAKDRYVFIILLFVI